MKYLVTKEIKSETQVFWIFYLQDFMFLALWAVVCMMAKVQIHSALDIPYALFSALVGVVLMLPSRVNPKRRNYQSLVLYIMRPRNVYRFGKEQQGEAKGNRVNKKGHSLRRI